MFRAHSERGSRAGLWPILALVGLMWTASGCLDDEGVFTEGRLEDPCNGSIPVCKTQAACVLEPDEYFRGSFPGGVRKIVRSDADKSKLVVRLLLTEPLFPGTELLVQAFTPGCGDFAEEHVQNVDLFDFAGDDRIIEFELELEGRGDHLLEIFSDMSSEYILALVVEDA